MADVTISDRLVAAHNLGLPSYNPRLLPSVLGAVYILHTHVCVSEADESEDVTGGKCWFNEGYVWINGLPRKYIGGQ